MTGAQTQHHSVCYLTNIPHFIFLFVHFFPTHLCSFSLAAWLSNQSWQILNRPVTGPANNSPTYPLFLSGRRGQTKEWNTTPSIRHLDTIIETDRSSCLQLMSSPPPSLRWNSQGVWKSAPSFLCPYLHRLKSLQAYSLSLHTSFHFCLWSYFPFAKRTCFTHVLHRCSCWTSRNGFKV